MGEGVCRRMREMTSREVSRPRKTRRAMACALRRGVRWISLRRYSDSARWETYLVLPYQWPRDWVRNSTTMAMRMTQAAPWAHAFMPRMMCSRELGSRGVVLVRGLCGGEGGWTMLREVSSCSYMEGAGVWSSVISSVKRDCLR